MSKIRSIVIILGAILLVIPSVARAQATPTEIKLLTQNTGWALMHGRLYWTIDFGHDWHDITPPEVRRSYGAAAIADVFFLDTSNGWALLRRGDAEKGGWAFEVASTDDSGITWSVTRLSLPGWWSPYYLLGHSGSIAFADAGRGWIDLSVQSSPASRLGTLLATTDGGRTWSWLKKGLGVAASMRFVSASVGWAAGGPVGSELYVTRDGGRTWQSVTPIPPAEVGTPVTIETASLKRVPRGGHAVLPTYGLPVFRDSLHGYLPVSYAGWQPGEPRGPERLVVYETGDGGVEWRPIRVLATKEESTAGDRVPVGIADSTLFVPLPSPEGRPAVAAVSLVRAAGASPGVKPTMRGVSLLSFISGQRGWVLSRRPANALHATGNGGTTWLDVTPGLRAAGRHRADP